MQNFLFQSIPLQPPSNLFPKLKEMTTNFIWNNKRPRLRLTLLYLPFERGGLKVPNFIWYYWAAQISAAMFWFSDISTIPWVSIENVNTSPLPLKLYLYSNTLTNLLKDTHNPFVKNTIRVWYKIQSYFKIDPVISGFTPIWGNSRFSPGKRDLGFKLWAERGISKVMDMYNEDGLLYSFDDLKTIYNIPSKHFFKYLQIRSYILTALKQSPYRPPVYSRTGCY